jgi:hypothetical protein
MLSNFWSFLNSRRRLIYFFLVVGLLIYSSALPNQMFWDDQDGILNNAYIKDWQYFEEYFSQNLIAGSGLQSNYWRPVLLIIYSLEWHLWGDWAPGYHLVNILAHIAAALALFYLFKKVLKKRSVALFSALIFLIHPLQTEAVTYVSGLADPLSSLFIFLALILFLKSPPKRDHYFYWSLAFFGLSLMTKEKSAIIFPSLLILILFLWLIQEKSGQKWKFIFSFWSRLWPFILMGSVYVLLRATSLNFQDTFNIYVEKNPYTESILVRLATFLKILPQYISLIFWPHNLHMERVAEFQTTFKDPQVILGSALALASLLLLVFGIKKKNKVLIFSIGWFWATMFPASGIMAPMSGLMYEHYLYLPLIGVFGGLFYFGGWWIKERGNPLILKIALGSLIVYFLFLSTATFLRNKIWHDPIIFYNNIILYNPNSLRVWNNLGMAYAEKSQWEKALESYRRAAALDSRDQSAPPHHNLANAFTHLSREEEAIEEYQRALLIDPEFTFSYGALLDLYLKRNDNISAVKLLREAFQHFPNDLGIKSALLELEKKQ